MLDAAASSRQATRWSIATWRLWPADKSAHVPNGRPAGARCLWLIEPTKSPRERAHRGALVALDSLTQLRKWAEPDPGGELYAKVNRNELAFRKVMRRHGYNPDRRLNTTDIVTTYGVAWAWRWTSGFAHGVEWAITSGRLVSVRPGEYRRQQRVETQPNLDHLVDLTSKALEFVDRGRATLEAYAAPLSSQTIYKVISG